MALDLAGDRRRGERREGQAALRLEPLHRLQESEGRDLLEVVDGLPAPGEPAGQRDRQPEVLGDELVAEPAVLGLAVLEEPRQRLVGSGSHPSGTRLNSRKRR